MNSRCQLTNQLSGAGHIVIRPGAGSGGDGAAQRGGFADHRHPHRQAGDVAEDLAPQRAFRAAAGKHPGCRMSPRRTARSARGCRRRQSPRSLPARGTGSAFYCTFPDRDGEVNKRRRGVVPLLKVHSVGKIGITPWEPAGTRLAISPAANRHRRRAVGNQFFFSAERRRETSAHGQAGKRS